MCCPSWMARYSQNGALPAVSNYSEWVVPEVGWASSDTVFLRAPETGGQLDELTSPFRLIREKEGQQQVMWRMLRQAFYAAHLLGQRA